jgi:glutamyl-tRNA reductase
MRLTSGCLLKIGVIGISHKTADLSFRESLAKGAAALSGDKSVFFPHPIVLLSTCNRVEIYFGGENLTEAHSDLLRALRYQISDSFEHRLYSYFGIDCFVHLGKVTAGLDSAIVLETEIQRQVKIAYSKAAKFSRLSSCMHYVFQKALRLGKIVRNESMIDRGFPHLFQAIWILSQDVLEKKILLIGHSDINRNLANFLYRRGIQNFSLVTQNPEAVSIQGAHPLGREELKNWLEYDLIICAASSKQYLLDGEGRKGQVLFDLSVPRNVDPKIQGVRLYNIEEVNQWIEKRRTLQVDKVEQSTELVRMQAIRMAKHYKQKVSLREIVHL